MKFTLRKSISNWITVPTNEGEVKFLIDYPTREQGQTIQTYVNGEIYSGNDKYLKALQYLIKFTVKDWRGVKDENGNEIPCVVVNNELEDELWWMLVRDEERATSLGILIQEEIKFTETDKKK